MSDSFIAPSSIACRISPASDNAPLYVSTNTSARATASPSASRISCLKAPTRSRCCPSCSHSPFIIASIASVAQEIMSASCTAASRSVTGSIEKDSTEKFSTTFLAACSRRPQIRTLSISLEVACAATICGASLPVPTISSVFESPRDRYLAARADAAAVRRSVSSVPSSTARGTPVVASIRK